MALTTTSDSELLVLFRSPATKEQAYTSIIKKYQEKLYWHIRRMVVDHEDANDVLHAPSVCPPRQRRANRRVRE